MDFQPEDYGPAVAELLSRPRLPALGPGSPDGDAHSALQSLDRSALFGDRRVVDAEMADCCLSALWLWHDYLDESHRISQNVASTSGSFWHGIMHRREPDYSNAKYWFRRVGEHSVFPRLAEEVRGRAAAADPAGPPARITSWDPFQFVDWCEQAARGESRLEPVLREAAVIEWRLLFDHCYRRALAA